MSTSNRGFRGCLSAQQEPGPRSPNLLGSGGPNSEGVLSRPPMTPIATIAGRKPVARVLGRPSASSSKLSGSRDQIDEGHRRSKAKRLVREDIDQGERRRDRRERLVSIIQIRLKPHHPRPSRRPPFGVHLRQGRSPPPRASPSARCFRSVDQPYHFQNQRDHLVGEPI